MSPDQIVANTVGGTVLMVLSTLSGYSIIRTSVPPWWIWAYYLSPYSWSVRALAINEMNSPSWTAEDPNNPGQTIGQTSLLTFSFFLDNAWIWWARSAYFEPNFSNIIREPMTLELLSGVQSGTCWASP